MEITRIGLILLFVLTPTYMPKTETLRACDIIIPSSQGRCVAICYVYETASRQLSFALFLHFTTPIHKKEEIDL